MNALNSETYLTEAIESVIAQTFTNWEIIVWDNGSKDRTQEIVLSIGDPRIRYFYDDFKVSLYQSRLNALRVCRGGLVAFLDHDDAWLPRKLELQVPVFDDHQVVASATSFWRVPSTGKLSPSSPGGRKYETYRRTVTSVYDLTRHYKVAMSALMTRTAQAIEVIPDPPPDLSVIEDFDLVFRLVSRGPLVPVRVPLMLYRQHQSNYSSNTDIYRNEVRIWTDWFMPLPDEDGMKNDTVKCVRDNYLRASARRALASGDKLMAASLARQMTWGYDRIRLLSALLLPKALLRHLTR